MKKPWVGQLTWAIGGIAAVAIGIVLMAAGEPSLSSAKAAPSPGGTVAPAGADDSAADADSDTFARLRAGHPRLMILDSDLPRVRELIDADPLVKQWDRRLSADAEKMLSEPLVEHKLTGAQMLFQSRDALRRITTLGGLYRLHGDKRFARRAIDEMMAAAAMTDWNPRHFLDVAEMTNAVGIGYDWLYSELSPSQRSTIREAIVRNGLKPGLDAFARHLWWTHDQFNWAQVCDGGLAVGALAVADDEPEVAARVIRVTGAGIVKPMQGFAPDGGTEEGPVYWNYATAYNVFYLAAMNTAFGGDTPTGGRSLTEMPGFAQTGDFRIYFVGPTRKAFNFADAAENPDVAPQMLWMARRFNQPIYAAHERLMTAEKVQIFHLLWADTPGEPGYAGKGATEADAGARPGDLDESKPAAAVLPGDAMRRDGQEKPDQGATGARRWNLPLDAFFRRARSVYFRGAWGDRDAVFVGFRGGENAANHSHLDLGSFVIDADGQRWAMLLGPDDYGLPGYFGEQRWTYYRMRTEGANTLTLDGQNQQLKAAAPIVAFHSIADESFAVADLSAGYAPVAGRVMRGVALLNRRDVLIRDEIEAAEPVGIVWSMNTPAKAQIDADGRGATLTRGLKTMRVELLIADGGRFLAEAVNPPAPQRAATGVTKLMVTFDGKLSRATIAVLFSPGDLPPGAPRNHEVPARARAELADWVAEGRVGE